MTGLRFLNCHLGVNADVEGLPALAGSFDLDLKAASPLVKHALCVHVCVFLFVLQCLSADNGKCSKAKAAKAAPRKAPSMPSHLNETHSKVVFNEK